MCLTYILPKVVGHQLLDSTHSASLGSRAKGVNDQVLFLFKRIVIVQVSIVGQWGNGVSASTGVLNSLFKRIGE